MSLELARFLVERGLVDAGRMDDVLQRQVLFGGSLDTNLLEVGLVDEASVSGALADFHRLPAAGPELLAQRDPRMPKLFPARLAQKYQVVPVVMSGRSLLVLAAGRIDPLWVDEINFMLSLSVRTHVVCEARLQALMRDWLGLEIEPRYAALAERLGPLGGAPPSPEPEPEVEEGVSVESQAAREALAAVALPPPSAALQEPPAAESPAPEASARPALDDDSRVRVAQALGTLVAREAVERVRREKARSGQLSLAEAAQACMEAADRDAIVDVLLRFCRQSMEFVGLFVVQDETIFGWDAVGSPDARDRIRRLRLPASAPSVLRTVLLSQAAFLGPVPSSGNNQELLQSLGRSRPLNVLIAPLTVHARIVALLYGDAGVRSIRSQRVGDVLVLLSRMSEAFERLILRRKGLLPGTVPAPRASRTGLPVVAAPPPVGPGELPEVAVEEVSTHEVMVTAPDLEQAEPAAPAPDMSGPIVGEPALERTTPEPQPEERWKDAASRTLELPVVEEPPLEVDGQATWDEASARAEGAAARSTQEGLTFEPGDEAALELDQPPPPAPAPELAVEVRAEGAAAPAAAEVEAPPAPTPVAEPAEAAPTLAQVELACTAAPVAEAPSAVQPEAKVIVEPALAPVTAFSAPPSAPPPLAAPLAAQPPDEPDIPDDYMLGAELPPAIDASALGVPLPPPPPPRVSEERVRIEAMEEEAPAVVTTVDTDSDVVVVDTVDDFVPLKVRAEPSPEAPCLTPRHPFPAAAPVPETAPVAAPAPRPTSPAATTQPLASLEPVPTLEVGAVPPSEAAVPPAGDAVAPDGGRLTALVTKLVGPDPLKALQARVELVGIGPPALGAIMLFFPGRLLCDVRTHQGPLPPLVEHGELLACLIDMGAEACQAVAEKLEAPDPVVRYYAVSFLGAVPCSRAVGRLSGRLYDRDPRVRQAAIEVLGTYRRTPGYEAMLRGLRARLQDPDQDQQAIAAALLGNFRDVESLPDLVMLLRAPSKVASRAAAESLAYITKQDLGTSERKWLKWWKEHKGEDRVVWLIEGLRSKNRDIRYSSIQELIRLTRESFNYDFDGERADRERATRRWEQWWAEKGRNLHLDA